ncbi:YybH family protein [Tenacibaculum retecalamus]|uniref:YybH family protein n=1 Tax=Tenacibaculum retecalamus TaxID=3018315 RepID=UPI0023D96D73|nr:nuclear transport factor 2 family protein [Tenacibaculum retecalamus]WBX72256.1 nuclear transport factor 2 family protein [Tenacibaculum retecalamus]
MKKLLVFSVLFLAIIVSCKKEIVTVDVSEETEKKEILAIMKAQEKAWSNHDLEGFMQGYWKSDSLKFYGSNGITFGWDKTLANYKKGYPTKDHSGELKFKVNDISKINSGAYFVMGAYHLTRKVGNANGVFMIIFKKINGEWKIIADTSC